MNKKLDEILETASAEEAEQLLSGIEHIDFKEEDEVSARRIRKKVLERCGVESGRIAEEETAAKKRSFNWKRFTVAAAACLLVVGACLGVYAFVKENREYKAAVAFFDEHGLPADGLTRKEIRNVYKDISSNSFSDPMSEKVLTAYANNLRLSSEMVFSGTNSRSNSAYLWAFNNSFTEAPYSVDLMVGASLLYDGNVHFDREWVTLNYENHSTGFLEKCVFSKYVGSEPVWSVDFPLERIEIYSPVSDGVLVAGTTDIINAETVSILGNGDLDEDELEQLRQQFIKEELPKYADHAVQRRFIAKISDSGEIVFKTYFDRLEAEADYEDYYDYIEYRSILFETPEGCALLESGRHNYRAFIMTRFSENGELLGFSNPSLGEYGNLRLQYAAPVGNGAVALLGNDYVTYNSIAPDPVTFNVVRIGTDGSVTEIGTFTAPYPHFCISGIAEHGGKIWISGYRWQDTDNSSSGGLYGYELRGVVSEIWADMDRWSSGEGFFVPSDYLTPRVREVYEAKLFLLDEGGTVSEVWSVPGALGSVLYVGADGSLVWNVDSISSTFFSPATSSFIIGGACNVERYRFVSSEISPAVEPTGAVVIFRR